VTAAVTTVTGYRSPHPRRATTKVGPGECYVTAEPEEAITTVLGSCVAACMRDSVTTVGGMNHFMLPASEKGDWGGVPGSLRFGNFAMKRLIDDILKRGGRRERLEVKLFGGGDVLGSGASVGDQNADFAEAFLGAEGIRILAQHMRGHKARRVEYFPFSGRAMMIETAMSGDPAVAVRNTQYCNELEAAMPPGEVGLLG